MSYSQCGQDSFVLEYFGKNYKGFFIDIGANDGVTYSNTKLLEDNNWKGICIEPLIDTFNKLSKNRNSINLNIGLDIENGEKEFMQIEGYSEMLSGIVENYDPKHINRIENEIKTKGGNKKIVKIITKRFSDIINEKEIDYVSIDVEGSEFNILQGIDFNKHNIKIFGIENNYKETFKIIEEFLISKNYSILKEVGHDVFFKLNS